jgi:hypothetical protein
VAPSEKRFHRTEDPTGRAHRHLLAHDLEQERTEAVHFWRAAPPSDRVEVRVLVDQTPERRSLPRYSTRPRFRCDPIRGRVKYLVKAVPTTIMTYIPKEPPEDIEQYENVDQALDEQDATGEGVGQRDLEDMTADRTELEEAGADLEDEGRISMRDGGLDDPDGSGPPEDRGVLEAGWDVDPVTADRGGGEQADVGAEGDAVTEDELIDVPDFEDDPELELIDTDPTELEQIPDDAPGADSARW